MVLKKNASGLVNRDFAEVYSVLWEKNIIYQANYTILQQPTHTFSHE